MITERLVQGLASAFITAFFMGTCTAAMGCSTSMMNESSWGFRQKSEWEFYSKPTKINEGATATVNIESQPLTDYLAKDEPEGGGNADEPKVP